MIGKDFAEVQRELVESRFEKYATMSVKDILSEVINLFPEAPCNNLVRIQLLQIRDQIWLELPESRCQTLTAIGKVLNQNVPREVVEKGYSNAYPYWFDVKHIMEAALKQFVEAKQ